MIIQCQQCQTRFKVGDDKLAAGPIRVRCSKCNFVFMASKDAMTSTLQQPRSNDLPSTTVQQIPQGGFPSAPPPANPAASKQGPVTAMFAAFDPMGGPTPPPSSSSSGGGFASPQNRSGIFRAPSQGSAPGVGSSPPTTLPPSSITGPPAPTADPFNLNAGQPRSGVVDPFAAVAGAPQRTASQSGPSPFSPPPPFSSSPPTTSDPFAALGGGSPTPAPNDPFAGLGRTKTGNDPFAGFGGGTSPPRAPTPMAQPQVPPPSDGPIGMGDPFSGDAIDTSSLFGGGTPAPSSQPQPDPFRISTDGSDPFGALGINNDVTADDVDRTASMPKKAFGPPGFGPSSAPPVPNDDADPFAGLDADVTVQDDAEQPSPAEARPPPKRPTTAAPAAAPSSTAPARQETKFGPASQQAGADMQRLRRLQTMQRARELAWSGAQALILLVFIVVAVVIARGGSLTDLVAGRFAEAVRVGAVVRGELAIEEATVRRRSLPAGVDVVLVSGFVRNTTDKNVPGARVDVKFGDAPTVASGWAWSTVDGIDVMAIKDAPEAGPLSLRPPKTGTGSLAPGERAPFVVVAPAPQEGLRASFEVHPIAPPPSQDIPLSPLPPADGSAPAPSTPPATPTTPASTKPAPAAPASTTPVKAGTVAKSATGAP